MTTDASAVALGVGFSVLAPTRSFSKIGAMACNVDAPRKAFSGRVKLAAESKNAHMTAYRGGA
ncbi:hypothetical protein O4H52_14815 [Sphingomonadaceae bacterium G21617-S1]|uniref:hypothetical protein n=1 Tax=Rhizorhabdus sp. TaxID=1968843 RepID=UPI001214529C|nr:hypothetical protein [Rhizorhabdus sp.]MBD3760586.1 hypothetical protein [Rhizorhabdus sp.]MCZ4342891.1 hypothetical protein [Sphingomonadaceae bacterium G21617-S1]TAK07341.1 MAG: hypothetical protein EPO38_12890 [Rhizorhabdus sp.]